MPYPAQPMRAEPGVERAVAVAVAPGGALAAALVTPAPIIPSTSLSISNCSTASATARRKSPSPAFSSKSASTNLSSVIGSSRVLQVEVWQLHLSRPGPMATSTTPQPDTDGVLRVHSKGRFVQSTTDQLEEPAERFETEQQAA